MFSGLNRSAKLRGTDAEHATASVNLLTLLLFSGECILGFMKNKKIVIIIASTVIVFILALGVFLQSTEQKEETRDESLVSQKGLHYHADLAIIVKGKRVDVPPNTGLVGGHNPMHTHDGEPNIIHMEFPGIVRADDLMLGEFFKVWKKDMRSFGANMKMTVNGKENTEFENYHMKDKDKIELQYE